MKQYPTGNPILPDLSSHKKTSLNEGLKNVTFEIRSCNVIRPVRVKMWPLFITAAHPHNPLGWLLSSSLHGLYYQLPHLTNESRFTNMSEGNEQFPIYLKPYRIKNFILPISVPHFYGITLVHTLQSIGFQSSASFHINCYKRRHHHKGTYRFRLRPG
jgi:hypothetical protein